MMMSCSLFKVISVHVWSSQETSGKRFGKMLVLSQLEGRRGYLMTQWRLRRLKPHSDWMCMYNFDYLRM